MADTMASILWVNSSLTNFFKLFLELIPARGAQIHACLLSEPAFLCEPTPRDGRQEDSEGNGGQEGRQGLKGSSPSES